MNKLFLSGIRLNREIPKNDYICNLPVVESLKNTELKISKNVSFFVGENGAGKSTLLEAIAISLGFNPEGGTINFNFSTRDSHSDLNEYITAIRGVGNYQKGFFYRAESFYNVASSIDRLDEEPSFSPPIINSYGGISLHKQSHGESFLSLVENRFSGNGLYIMDEPEAALSPNNILRLMVLMYNLVQKGAQFLISTHSPILMTFPESEIFSISERGINIIPYYETEHYQITKNFLDNPDRMLRYLLDDDSDDLEKKEF